MFETNEIIQWVLGIICGYGLYIAYMKYDLYKKEKEIDKLIWGDRRETPTGSKGTK